MADTPELSAEEQKYFDTKGEQLPPSDDDMAAREEANVDEKPLDRPGDPKSEEDKEFEQNPGKFVRHGAFHEERERRKNLERELAEERRANADRNARLEERLGFLANAMQQDQQGEQGIDWDDPQQVARAAFDEARQARGELYQRQQYEQQETQVYQQQQAFNRALSSAEQEFAAAHGDYYDAVDFAKAARDKELQVLGYRDPQVRAQIIWNDIVGISNDAFRERRNPAEAWYNYAKERGFQGGTPTQGQNDQKLRTIARGQQAGKSLGAASGQATPSLTLENVANMSDDEFRKVALDRKAWRKLMGG